MVNLGVKALSSSLVLCFVVPLFGCSHRSTSYAKTWLTSAPAEASAPAEGSFVPGSISLYLAESELPDICGARTNLTARFDAGADVLSEAGRLALRELAQCLAHGPLSGSHVRLVGKTAPREAKDPLELGLSRAVHVEQILIDDNIDPRRIEVASEGDTASRQQDPSTWPDARRVDILILRPQPVPLPLP